MAQWTEVSTQRGSPHVPTWLVALGARDAAAVDAPAPGPMPSYEIAKLGLGPLPDSVALMQVGKPNCVGKVTGYLAIATDDPPGRTIAATVEGCPAPTADDSGLAWIAIAGAPPLGCELRTPTRRSEHVGSGDGDDFRVDEPSATLDDAWRALASAPCDDCDRLWTVDTIDTTPAISSVTITDLAPGSRACDRAHGDTSGVYTRDTADLVHAIPPATPSVLVGALSDPRGLRVALFAGAGTWEAIDIAGDGTPAAHRSVTYLVARDEQAWWPSLAPHCEP
jgi:hypothetical protein